MSKNQNYDGIKNYYSNKKTVTKLKEVILEGKEKSFKDPLLKSFSANCIDFYKELHACCNDRYKKTTMLASTFCQQLLNISIDLGIYSDLAVKLTDRPYEVYSVYNNTQFYQLVYRCRQGLGKLDQHPPFEELFKDLESNNKIVAKCAKSSSCFKELEKVFYSMSDSDYMQFYRFASSTLLDHFPSYKYYNREKENKKIPDNIDEFINIFKDVGNHPLPKKYISQFDNKKFSKGSDYEYFFHALKDLCSDLRNPDPALNERARSSYLYHHLQANDVFKSALDESQRNPNNNNDIAELFKGLPVYSNITDAPPIYQKNNGISNSDASPPSYSNAIANNQLTHLLFTDLLKEFHLLSSGEIKNLLFLLVKVRNNNTNIVYEGGIAGKVYSLITEHKYGHDAQKILGTGGEEEYCGLPTLYKILTTLEEAFYSEGAKKSLCEGFIEKYNKSFNNNADVKLNNDMVSQPISPPSNVTTLTALSKWNELVKEECESIKNKLKQYKNELKLGQYTLKGISIDGNKNYQLTFDKKSLFKTTNLQFVVPDGEMKSFMNDNIDALKSIIYRVLADKSVNNSNKNNNQSLGI